MFNESFLSLSVPLDIIGPAIPANQLCKILGVHDVPGLSQRTKTALLAAIAGHHCSPCDDHIVVLKKIPLFTVHKTSGVKLHAPSALMSPLPPPPLLNTPCESVLPDTATIEYLPPPLDEAQEASIMQECVSAMDPSVFQEAGCTAVQIVGKQFLHSQGED
ncbi:hypothetical protein EDD18DRAFT_1347228 [Armillaria luteobubalina]|uniref:Uncharacterized protein n=1 Tax=Armillaria luteobubalina TaxID=153913 RepID=A0AA39V274_9AGAR|nr:hypothetical protein EDD18DRAFT_1347228 [Armillaria luteobubalina]